MGLRGPAPTPTAILKARGSWRADERSAEPTPREERPTCPTWLSKEAKAEWIRICKQLAAMNLLAAADRALLVTYCEAWAEYAEMEQLLKKMPRVLKGPKGVYYLNPVVSVRNRAFERLRHAAAQFGLSPASRARVQVEKPTHSSNAKARFFQPSNN